MYMLKVLMRKLPRAGNRSHKRGAQEGCIRGAHGWA